MRRSSLGDSRSLRPRHTRRIDRASRARTWVWGVAAVLAAPGPLATAPSSPGLPASLVCPPGAYFENEPTCRDDYVDEWNSGCGGNPVVFGSIPGGAGPDDIVVMCGEYGGFRVDGGDSRDTDWLALDGELVHEDTRWCFSGEYEALIGYIDPAPCEDVSSFVDWQYVAPLETACFELPQGDLWLWIATSGFGPGAGECGGRWIVILEDYYAEPISVTPSSWGRVKAEYRPTR